MLLKTNCVLMLMIAFICACNTPKGSTEIVLDSDCHEYTPDSNELFVDLSCSVREVTHCASGSLYGITEDNPENIAELVAPLHPYSFVQPPFGTLKNQHPYGAASAVAQRIEPHTDARVMILLADLLPVWPYRWPGKEAWLELVEAAIDDKLASGLDNYYGYMIWNEPSETWDDDNGDFFSECWLPTYELIRSKDPDANIIGPGDAYFNQMRMTGFLQQCKENNVVPDIMAWHELQGSARITSHVTDYRALESSLEIDPLPISINEYCHPVHENEGAPGPSAVFIAKFERNKIDGANISWWFTSLPGRLGSLLTAENQKGGGWWFYKWYGDMAGAMATVVPPNDLSDGLDGFASLDKKTKRASICFGGNATGTKDIVVNGIPSDFGNSVTVTVEYIPWENKDSPVAGPVVISKTTYEVSAEMITVPVEITNPMYGYRVLIEPNQ